MLNWNDKHLRTKKKRTYTNHLRLFILRVFTVYNYIYNNELINEKICCHYVLVYT